MKRCIFSLVLILAMLFTAVFPVMAGEAILNGEEKIYFEIYDMDEAGLYRKYADKFRGADVVLEIDGDYVDCLPVLQKFEARSLELKIRFSNEAVYEKMTLPRDLLFPETLKSVEITCNGEPRVLSTNAIAKLIVTLQLCCPEVLLNGTPIAEWMKIVRANDAYGFATIYENDTKLHYVYDLAEKGKLPVNEGDPVYSGKLIFLVLDETELTSQECAVFGENFYGIPTSYLAQDFDHADTAVYIFPVSSLIGTYANGGEARTMYTRVRVVDLHTLTTWEPFTAVKNEPPETIAVTTANGEYSTEGAEGLYEPETAVYLVINNVTNAAQTEGTAAAEETAADTGISLPWMPKAAAAEAEPEPETEPAAETAETADSTEETETEPETAPESTDTAETEPEPETEPAAETADSTEETETDPETAPENTDTAETEPEPGPDDAAAPAEIETDPGNTAENADASADNAAAPEKDEPAISEEQEKEAAAGQVAEPIILKATSSYTKKTAAAGEEQAAEEKQTAEGQTAAEVQEETAEQTSVEEQKETASAPVLEEYQAPEEPKEPETAAAAEKPAAVGSGNYIWLTKEILYQIFDALQDEMYRKVYEAILAGADLAYASKGNTVLGVQMTLNAFGQTVETDSSFGNATLTALNNVQTALGIPATKKLNSAGYAMLMPGLLVKLFPDTAKDLLDGLFPEGKGSVSEYLQGCLYYMDRSYYRAKNTFENSRFMDYADRALNCVQDMPETGQVYRNEAIKGNNAVLNAQVNSYDASAVTCIQIYTDQNILAASLIIRGTGSAQTSLPAGNYRILDGTGYHWYGTGDLFGEEGTYESMIFDDGSDRITLESGYDYTITFNVVEHDQAAQNVGSEPVDWMDLIRQGS